MSFLLGKNCDQEKKEAYEKGFNDGLNTTIANKEKTIERLRLDYKELARATENIQISTPDTLRDRLENILDDISGEKAHWSLFSPYLKKQERLQILEGHLQRVVLDLQRPIYNILRAYYITGKASIDPTTLEILKGLISPELNNQINNETKRLSAIKREREEFAQEDRNREISPTETIKWFQNNPYLQVNSNRRRSRRPSLNDDTPLPTVRPIVTSKTSTTSTTSTTLSSRTSLAEPFVTSFRSNINSSQNRSEL